MYKGALKEQHLSLDKGGRHKAELQDGQGGKHLVDALEDVVVQVPGPMQLSLALALLILLAPLMCLCQLVSKVLQSHMCFRRKTGMLKI